MSRGKAKIFLRNRFPAIPSSNQAAPTPQRAFPLGQLGLARRRESAFGCWQARGRGGPENKRIFEMLRFAERTLRFQRMQVAKAGFGIVEEAFFGKLWQTCSFAAANRSEASLMDGTPSASCARRNRP